MKKTPDIKSIIFFENGNVAVFGIDGKQMPELQDGWINFSHIKKLAKYIATQDIDVTGTCPELNEYVDFYRTNMEFTDD